MAGRYNPLYVSVRNFGAHCIKNDIVQVEPPGVAAYPRIVGKRTSFFTGILMTLV